MVRAERAAAHEPQPRAARPPLLLQRDAPDELLAVESQHEHGSTKARVLQPPRAQERCRQWCLVDERVPCRRVPVEEGLLDDGELGHRASARDVQRSGARRDTIEGVQMRGHPPLAVEASEERLAREHRSGDLRVLRVDEHLGRATNDAAPVGHGVDEVRFEPPAHGRHAGGSTLERTARRARRRRHRLARRPGGPARCRHGGSTRCTSQAPGLLRPARGGRRALLVVRPWPARRAASAGSLRRSRDGSRKPAVALAMASSIDRGVNGSDAADACGAPSHRRPAINAIRSRPRAVLAPRTVSRSR